MQLYRPARTQQGRRSAVGNWAPDVYGRGLGKTRTRLIGDVKFKDSLSSNVEDIGRRSAFVGFGNTAPDTRADVFGLAQRGVKRTVAAGGSGNFLPGTGAGYDCRDHRHALDSQRVVIVQLARRDPVLARGVVHQLVARPATFLQPRMRTSSFSSVVAKADLVLRSKRMRKRYGKHNTGQSQTVAVGAAQSQTVAVSWYKNALFNPTPEGHGTHTNGTAYTRGTYSRVHTNIS